MGRLVGVSDRDTSSSVLARLHGLQWRIFGLRSQIMLKLGIMFLT